MAKLIPGKLRMEGVELYETGQIAIIKEQEHRIYARVAEEEIRYSLDAVSYTHLDVYKRQLRGFLQCFLLSRWRWFLLFPVCSRNPPYF